MSRVVIISFIIVGALLWLGLWAKRSEMKTLSTASFTAAVVYLVIMLASFTGLIGE